MYQYWEEKDLQYQEYQKYRQKEKRLEKKEIAGERLRVICDAEEDVPTRLRENAHLEKLGQCRLEDLSAICRRNHVMVSGSKDELVLRVFLLCKHGGPGSPCKVCSKGKQEFAFKGKQINSNAKPTLKCRHKTSERSNMCYGKAACKSSTREAICASVEEAFLIGARTRSPAAKPKAKGKKRGRDDNDSEGESEPEPEPESDDDDDDDAEPKLTSGAAVTATQPEMDPWVQCDKCDIWRLLGPGVDVNALPELWECSMYVEADFYCGVTEEEGVPAKRNKTTARQDEDEEFVPTRKVKKRPARR